MFVLQPTTNSTVKFERKGLAILKNVDNVKEKIMIYA